MDLKDKVVLITGASRGIGAATALLAARERAKVVVNYNKSKKEAEKVISAIGRSASGGQAIAIKADVSKREESHQMVNQLIEGWGKIDVLINNAGVYAGGPLEENSEKDINEQVDTNIKGVIYTTQFALPSMKKNKDGVIVNISSGAGKHGMAYLAVYCATKFAVIGFTQALAREVQQDNIRIYAVCPGHTATGMGDYTGIPVEKVAQCIIDCAKETLGLQSGQDTEIYS